MNREQLLLLREEILQGTNPERILELDINLKQFINILDFRVREGNEGKGEYSEAEIKEFKASISIARSYLRVIGWKLEGLRLEKETAKIDALTKNKKVILEMFGSSFETVMNSHSACESLRTENSKLKSQLSAREGEIADLKKRVNKIALEVVAILEKLNKG